MDIYPLYPGDIVFLCRNNTGIMGIADNNTVVQIYPVQLIEQQSYNINTRTLSFKRTSSYSGSLIVLSKENVTITSHS